MKVRIRENTLRIRLTQTEVAALARGEKVEQETRFAEASILTSSVAGSAAVPSPRASLQGSIISVQLPAATLDRWANSDEITIEEEQSTGDGPPLLLRIEKDFQCLHNEAEKIADAYPNPRRQSN